MTMELLGITAGLELLDALSLTGTKGINALTARIHQIMILFTNTKLEAFG